MHLGLNDDAHRLLSDLVRAIEANTAALERANDLADTEQNGPRG